MDASRPTLSDLLVSEQRSKGEEIMTHAPAAGTERLVLASLAASLVPTLTLVAGLFALFTSTLSVSLPLLGIGVAGLLAVYLIARKAESLAKRFKEGKALVDGADALARSRAASEVEAYYGVSRLDAELVPLAPGEKQDVTVFRGGSPVLLTLLFPTQDSPLLLLETSEALPARS